MKIKSIIVLIAIALSIGIIVATTGNASKYVSFSEARQMYSSGNKSNVHVVGQLTKDAQGAAIGIVYDPVKDPNFLAFTMVDEQQNKFRVITKNPPASMSDFSHSEQVVVVGKFNDKGDFVANEILMKCPSKYEENQIK